MIHGRLFLLMSKILHLINYIMQVAFEERISVSEVKKLIKKYGGVGYTMHCERDGTLFETTPITLKGNNSKFKYNRHL